MPGTLFGARDTEQDKDGLCSYEIVLNFILRSVERKLKVDNE